MGGHQFGGGFAVTMASKLFEEKTAMADACKYDGNAEGRGASWRTDVLNYFVSRCPDVEPWLVWAE